eukprot:jgi/Bigna1/91675/estExt_fgenesh1_pg.C_1120026
MQLTQYAAREILEKFGAPYLIGSLQIAPQRFFKEMHNSLHRCADACYFLSFVNDSFNKTGEISDKQNLPRNATDLVAATTQDIEADSFQTTIADYVVIGAGSAGCLVANRLSENGYNVVVLEAGDSLKEDLNDSVHDPMKYGAAFATTLNWGYATVEQPHCGDRTRCWRHLSREWHVVQPMIIKKKNGVHNTYIQYADIDFRLLHVHFPWGAREIYDQWAANGAFGWSADEALPYFKRYEDNSRGSSTAHGKGGDVRVSDIPKAQLSPIATAFHKACVQAGFEDNEDQNSLITPQDGVQIYQVYIRDDTGHRVTASRAFLSKILESPKLHVRPNSLVTGIFLTGNHGGGVQKAIGVTYTDRTDKKHLVLARNEIILSAGVIGSPQILLLSGIGPPSHLREVGIEPKVALRGVGSNLVDHPRVACKWESKLAGLNPMHLFSHVEANLYASSRNSTGPPDIQIQQMFWISSESTLKQNRFDRSVEIHGREYSFAQPPVSTGFNLKPHAVTPKSRGTIRLRSINAKDKPLIDPKYLSDRRDLDSIVEGIKICRKVVSQKAFEGIRGEELQPGKDVSTDKELEDWVRANVDTGYHPVGTCKMGSRGLEWMVWCCWRCCWGVENLRVIDASVMPIIPNGNTQAATFMIAEKGAEMILAHAQDLNAITRSQQ